MTVRRVLGYAWAAPNTLVGLALAAATRMSGGRVSVVDGVMEATGGAAAWLLRKAVPLPGGAQAITVGHVVLARDDRAAEQTRRHERVHVRQFERWGVLFLLAYAVASLAAFVKGGNFYRDNRFERAAYAADTGA